MKHFTSRILLIGALALSLVIGVVALAETAEPEAPSLPSIEEAQPDSQADATTDSAALQDALNAYNSAKKSGRVEDLEAELKDYVASGKLTQEQADLILNYYKERESLRNGVCPNCGYEFQNRGGFGKGGRMNGGKDGRMNGGKGGMRGSARQPEAGRNDGTANGTSFQQEWQVAPSDSRFGGI